MPIRVILRNVSFSVKERDITYAASSQGLRRIVVLIVLSTIPEGTVAIGYLVNADL